ncbi:MAG: FecR family protein, partial [Flavobacteriales bacterium]
MNTHSEHTVNTELLAKYFSGEATDTEIKIIESWRDSSLEYQKEFNEYKLVWVDTGVLKEELNPSIEINTNRAWKKIQNRIGSTKTVKLNPKYNWKFVMRIAAVVAIVFGGIWAIQNNTDSPIENQLLASNEVVNFTFSDSSKIVLNKNAKITYPEKFEGKERKVKLSGEAHFSITPDKEKPFIIEVDKATVKVLGTSFVVKEMKEDSLVKVLVESGKVKFEYKNEKVILTKGMSASLDLRTEKIKVDSKEDVNIGAWKSKKLLFRSTEISEVFAQIEDLYGVTIQVENPRILDCELSATFD